MICHYSVDPPLEFKGPLALNSYLDKGERFLEGRIHGPEHMIAIGKDIYTGIVGGEVVRINGDHITHVAKYGQPCEGYHQEAKCGRPLGMAYDRKRNHLVVADAYYGIYEIDLSSGKKSLLVPANVGVPGKLDRKVKLFNSVAVHSSGDVYFTSSSSEFGLQDGLYTVMANPSGRLLHWNRKQNITTTLLDELHFANGLLLSPDESFIVVAETVRAQLNKYYLSGPKQGQHEVFLSGLPGHPDNLTPGVDGFWAPLVTSRDAENPSLMASLTKVPLIRRFLIRVLYLIELPFVTVNHFLPNYYAQTAMHTIGHFSSVGFAFPARQTILKIDWNGNIVGSLHGSDKSVHGIAHVTEFGDYLLLGSPFNQYIGRVKLPQNVRKQFKIGVDATPKAEARTEKPPVATTTTPPPTTTPKPTTTTTTTAPPTTTTTPKPSTTTTTTPKPKTTSKPATASPPKAKPEKPVDPAPIHENSKDLPPPPPPEKLKVIKRGGQEGEF